jgi:hypothetical protein
MSSSQTTTDPYTDYRHGILRSALRHYELELRSSGKAVPEKDGFDRTRYLQSRIRSLKRQLPAPHASGAK